MPTTIREAAPDDALAVSECVQAAYALYVPRMGKKPAPMLADYAELIERGHVHVLCDEQGVAGIIVAFPKGEYLFVENVAVAQQRQDEGLGKQLMMFAETQARRLGLAGIELYTHIKMTENLVFYPRIGYAETHRVREDGYDRVYFRKVLE
ncbi:MAG: GNAT family N-acetyltransferase [Gammaproteobacteria bacterium]